MELREPSIAYARDLNFSQAPILTTGNEPEWRAQCCAQRLAFRIRILPRKVRGVISELVGRGNQTWNVVALSRERGRETKGQSPGLWRHVGQYRIVLRGT